MSTKNTKDAGRLSRAQCRAARGLLDWSQQNLADAAQVNVRTLQDFEAGRRTPHHHTLAAIRRAMEEAGIDFVPVNGGGLGVRFREPNEDSG